MELTPKILNQLNKLITEIKSDPQLTLIKTDHLQRLTHKLKSSTLIHNSAT